MPSARRRPSAATARRVEQAAGDLGAAAVARIEQRHEWFRALPAEQRSWVGLVAQAGIASFVEWFSGDQTRVDTGTDVFGTAPSELTRSISLGQTLDLVRTTVEVVEEHTSELAGPKDADRVHVLWAGAMPPGVVVPEEVRLLRADDGLRAGLVRWNETSGDAAWLVDPNGFVVLRYAPGFDPGDLRTDLARLLKIN